MSQSSDQEAYRPPRDDINAPDLYVPLMSFVTWVILSAIVLGTTATFTPEAFGRCASQGVAVIFLEVLLLKAGFYLLSDSAAPPIFVLTSWSGYKFFGTCLNLLTFLFLGHTAYYIVLAYNAFASAYFMRETLRVAWLATPGSPAAGKYFRLGIMVVQAVWALLLSR